VPLSIVAEKIQARPFMEYALSYALNNWVRFDASSPITYDNLRLIRSFEGSAAEKGFILVHVAMVAHSGKPSALVPHVPHHHSASASPSPP
jgi:indoleamine 2,3-dioxygenase